MTHETVTKITFSNEEIEAIRTMHEIALNLCELYLWDSDYDNMYIQDIKKENKTMNMKDFESFVDFIDNFRDFIYDNNKIQIVSK